MEGAPMGGPPMPPPEPGPPPKPVVAGPLSDVGDLFLDFDITSFIATHPNEGPDDVALSIWEKYGGNSDWTADRTKTGRRTEKDAERPAEQVRAANEKDEDARWERLPAGKTIGDVVTPSELASNMGDVIYGVVKQLSAPPAPAGSPGGGMPPMM